MSVFSSIAVTNSFHFREIDLSLYFIEYNEHDRKTAKSKGAFALKHETTEGPDKLHALTSCKLWQTAVAYRV